MITNDYNRFPKNRVDRFRIGDEVYSLEDLYKIQELEEHEGLVERHRARSA